MTDKTREPDGEAEARALSETLNDHIYTDVEGETEDHDIEVTAYLDADAVPIIAQAMRKAKAEVLSDLLKRTGGARAGCHIMRGQVHNLIAELERNKQ